jgi:hypothetical protein
VFKGKSDARRSADPRRPSTSPLSYPRRHPPNNNIDAPRVHQKLANKQQPPQLLSANVTNTKRGINKLLHRWLSTRNTTAQPTLTITTTTKSPAATAKAPSSRVGVEVEGSMNSLMGAMRIKSTKKTRRSGSADSGELPLFKPLL